MLDLANDCFHFVTGHFDIINTSSLHIYHSALILAPRKSLVWGIYKSHAHPFVRVVQGVPMSWDTSTTATTRPHPINVAVWSPCNRFIAIAWRGAMTVDLLDPVTLQKFKSLEFQFSSIGTLLFSPDGHMLTASGHLGFEEVFVVSWDLQTGGVVSTTKHPLSVGGYSLSTHPKPSRPFSYLEPCGTYSADGKFVGIYCWWGYNDTTTSEILIFDVTTGMHMHSHLISSGFEQARGNIWTQGESFQFLAGNLSMFAIFGGKFTSDATPTEVWKPSVPIHKLKKVWAVQLVPIPLRLVLISTDGILVWDPQSSKPLLYCTDTSFLPRISFSSNGCFFACSTSRLSEIYLWRESSTGYVLHEILVSTASPNPLLSPNGESLVMFGGHTIWLWHTKGFTTTPSRVPTQAPQNAGDFILDFAPDGVLAVVARREDSMVTVFNPNSSIPQLTINTGMGVYGVQVTRDTVVVVGDRKVVTWNLPTDVNIPDVRVDLKDGSWTTNLDGSPPGEGGHVVGASISPDSCQIAIVTEQEDGDLLSVYSVSTGAHLASTDTFGSTPWFHPDGHDIWCINNGGTGYKHARELDNGLGPGIYFEHLPEGHPSASSRGYRVTDDWWVLDPGGKRLLMLPPPWRSYMTQRVWKGHFLALLHGRLSEPVILDLELQP